MDVVLLSRLQFSLTIAFHFIFVSITVGLAWLLVLVEALGWRARDGEVYVEAAKFFGRIFGVTFVMGVATEIVMEFQFGMNWAGYSRFAGDVFGPLLAAEGLLPGILFPRPLSLWEKQGIPRHPRILHPHGRRRVSTLGLLDPGGKLMAAGTGRLYPAEGTASLAIVIGLIASVLQVVPFGHEHAKQGGIFCLMNNDLKKAAVISPLQHNGAQPFFNHRR